MMMFIIADILYAAAIPFDCRRFSAMILRRRCLLFLYSAMPLCHFSCCRYVAAAATFAIFAASHVCYAMLPLCYAITIFDADALLIRQRRLMMPAAMLATARFSMLRQMFYAPLPSAAAAMMLLRCLRLATAIQPKILRCLLLPTIISLLLLHIFIAAQRALIKICRHAADITPSIFSLSYCLLRRMSAIDYAYVYY